MTNPFWFDVKFLDALGQNRLDEYRVLEIQLSNESMHDITNVRVAAFIQYSYPCK